MKSYWILKIHKDGTCRYCSEILRMPRVLKFVDVSSREEPFHFSTVSEAIQYWRMYQRNRPADASDWVADFEEVEL